MYSLYIFQKKDDEWVLSKGKDLTPMFCFKTKEEACRVADLLKEEEGTDIYIQKTREKGRVIFIKA